MLLLELPRRRSFKVTSRSPLLDAETVIETERDVQVLASTFCAPVLTAGPLKRPDVAETSFSAIACLLP